MQLTLMSNYPLEFDVAAISFPSPEYMTKIDNILQVTIKCIPFKALWEYRAKCYGSSDTIFVIIVVTNGFIT